MAENNTILEKLDGLVARFEEVSTLITDPAVIADQKRYVKLTKEYKELGDLMAARKEYLQVLGNIEEAKHLLATEEDADIREMAREEMAASEERRPQLEEEIKAEEQQINASPKNLLSLLPSEFTYEDFLQMRQQQGRTGDGRNTLRTWKSRGYIEFDEITQSWHKVDALSSFTN